MPRYQYECEACGQNFEQRQSFTDDPLADCPLCGVKDSVERIITSVGIVFKGSGFYINDSRKDKTANGSKPKTESETGKSDKSSESKKESANSEKPAEKKSEAKTPD